MSLFLVSGAIGLLATLITKETFGPLTAPPSTTTDSVRVTAQ